MILLLSIVASPFLVFYSGRGYSDIPLLLDPKALSTILFFFLLSRGFVVSGLSTSLAHLISLRGRNSGFKVVALYAISNIFLSMLATNDGAILVMVPVGLKLSEITGLDPVFTIASGLLAANTGSLLFPFSNPQNIIIWQDYGVPLTSFLRVSLVVLGLASTTLFLIVYLKLRSIRIKGAIAYPKIRVFRLTGYITLGLLPVGILLSNSGYGVYAFLLGLIVYFLIDRYVIYSVDWFLALLLVFIFIDFNSIAYLISTTITNPIGNVNTVYWGTLFLSQVISNVPTTILITKLTSLWSVLFISSNIAGYITPLGSLANIIGLKLGNVSWRSYIQATILFSSIITTLGYACIWIFL